MQVASSSTLTFNFGLNLDDDERVLNELVFENSLNCCSTLLRNLGIFAPAAKKENLKLLCFADNVCKTTAQCMTDNQEDVCG